MSWKGVKQVTIAENIKSWCDEMGIQNYTITTQGEIDVDGGVYLNYKLGKLEELPYKFGRVTGYFSLEGCKKLISLKNCPEIILPNHMFNVDYCTNLNSLEGCPKEVGGLFYCRDCKRYFSKEEVMSYCKVGFNIYN